MTLYSNQFIQSVEAGFCDRNTCAFNPIPAVVVLTQATAIKPGVAVSLSAVTTNTISQVAASAVTSEKTTAGSVFGFTFYHTHKASANALDRIDVLPLGSGAIIYLEASEAITAGVGVAQIVSSGKIQVADSGEQIIGTALIGAAASGDIIPVMLNIPVDTMKA